MLNKIKISVSENVSSQKIKLKFIEEIPNQKINIKANGFIPLVHWFNAIENSTACIYLSLVTTL